MATRGSYVHNSMVVFFGHPENVCFMQFFSENWWFQTRRFTGLLELVQLYKQYPLEKFLIFTIYQNYTLALTLKRLGGGPKRPPPRHFARLLCNAQSSRRDTLWLFSFKFSAHFDTKFMTPGGTVLKLRNFLYMHVRPKMAPKCDFVYKINANWVFSHSSYKYAYFYSQWLKLICFSIIVLQKVSATNFTEKNNKNKRSKNKEIHKKFIKQ